MEKKTGYLLIRIVAVLSCAVSAGSLFLAPPALFTGSPEAITIGTTPDELSTRIWVAEEKGLFAKNGLNVTVKT